MHGYPRLGQTSSSKQRAALKLRKSKPDTKHSAKQRSLPNRHPACRRYHGSGTHNKFQGKKKKKPKKRQCRAGIVPFKRGKIPVLSDSYPLILSHCRMFLFNLKFPLNCTECMSLHGWFRATNAALLWPNSLAAAGVLFPRHLSTNTVCFGSEAPLLADHSLFMDE